MSAGARPIQNKFCVQNYWFKTKTSEKEIQNENKDENASES